MGYQVNIWEPISFIKNKIKMVLLFCKNLCGGEGINWL